MIIFSNSYLDITAQLNPQTKINQSDFQILRISHMLTLISGGVLCQNKQDGFYHVDTLCNTYYQCSNGIETLYTCPAGQFFHLDDRTCQATAPSNCQRK